MTNCTVMGIDWRELTWWQYQAALAGWNEHYSDAPKTSGSGVEISPERMRAVLANAGG